MFKQLFRPKADTATNGPSTPNSTDQAEPGTNGAQSSPRHWELGANAPKERSGEPEANRKAPVKPAPVIDIANPIPIRGALESFEEIYRNAPVKPPKVAYSSLGILRVIEMVHSPHLDGMSTESKRSAVLMALETVGVKAEDLLQDAMVRQRALNEYEESQQAKLKDLEAAKMKENGMIRAELDRLSAAHLVRVQANLDEVSRMQDNLRQWTERKEQESQQIAEAAAYCALQSSAPGGSLTATVARFGADAVVGKSAEAAAGKR